MISIFAPTEYIYQINETIKQEDRLDELVHICTDSNEQQGCDIIISKQIISTCYDWKHNRPPFIISNIEYSSEALLTIIFHLLGNDQKAWNYASDHQHLQSEITLTNKIKYGYLIETIELEALAKNTDAVSSHNLAILYHYGQIDEAIDVNNLNQNYQRALQKNKNTQEAFSFTSYHYASFLLDIDQLESAEELLNQLLDSAPSVTSKYALKSLLTKVWLKQLKVPYDKTLLDKLKKTLWEVLTHFEAEGREVEAGILLLDAAHIANVSDSFSESLGYISKSITIFKSHELLELLGHAFMTKGTLLYTWAQKDSPQFFKPSIESYQEALKIYTKEATPEVFADIHHKLANIYVDMPSENARKSIWAGVTVSSFNEALEYYTKETHPYEYGMICNNYGNAFTKFPQAVLTDNFEKALFYYQEALDVRGDQYPYERSLSLLNYLEASWKVGNDSDNFNQKRYDNMNAKALEVIQLNQEESLVNEAKKHLELLEALYDTVQN